MPKDAGMGIFLNALAQVRGRKPQYRQAQMTDKDKVLAVRLVRRWLRKEKGYHGEVVCLRVLMHGDYIHVVLLEPHGLFIIDPDLNVQKG